MRSFAVWYKKIKKEEKENVDLDIHINLWRNKKNNIFTFDFGLMVSNIKNIEDIHIYIPFKIDKIEDLGIKLKKNTNLINAIFNEVCSSDGSYPSRIKVEKKDEEKDPFMIYLLHKEDYKIDIIENDQNKQGSILKLNVKDILSDDEDLKEEAKKIKQYYFRIRFEQSAEEIGMIKDQESEKSVYSNMFKKIEIIDFRINDERTWSEIIKEKFCRGSKFKIKAVHYLLLRDANDEFIYFDGNINSRLLENEIWKDYISFNDKDIIAYHISKKIDKDGDKEEIENFICLTRFKFISESILLLFYYVLFVIFLAVIANAIYSELLYYLGPKDSSIVHLNTNLFVLALGIVICIIIHRLIKN